MKDLLYTIAIFAFMAVVFALGMSCPLGCSGMPIRWQPTEAIKQAADLSVADYRAVEPHVPADARFLVIEGRTAAEVVQAYTGLPKQRAQSLADTNSGMLSQAQSDANRPPPTPAQVGSAVIDRVEAVADTGFSLAQVILTALTGIAGAGGLFKLRERFVRYKTQAGQFEDVAAETFESFREVIQGIDNMPPGLKRQVKKVFKDGKVQSPETEQLVAVARKS